MRVLIKDFWKHEKPVSTLTNIQRNIQRLFPCSVYKQVIANFFLIFLTHFAPLRPIYTSCSVNFCHSAIEFQDETNLKWQKSAIECRQRKYFPPPLQIITIFLRLYFASAAFLQVNRRFSANRSLMFFNRWQFTNANFSAISWHLLLQSGAATLVQLDLSRLVYALLMSTCMSTFSPSPFFPDFWALPTNFCCSFSSPPARFLSI